MFRKTHYMFSLLLVIVLASVASTGTLAQEDTIITFWHVYGNPDQPEHQILKDAIASFEEAHPGITIEDTGYGVDDFNTALNTAMAAGDPPNIFQTWGGGVLKSQVDAGMVRNLTEDMADGWADSLSGMLSVVTFAGEIYAVPLEQAGVFFWYNTTIFADNDLEPPETFGELLEACDTLNEAGIAPIALANKGQWPGAFYMIYLTERVGGPEVFLNAAQRVEGDSFEDEAFIRAGELIQEMVDRNCFNEGFNGMDYPDDAMVLGSGLGAMLLQGNFIIARIETVNPDMIANNELGLFPFPAVEDGAGDMRDLVGGVNTAFALASDAPDEAVGFLRTLTSPEVQEQLATEAKRMPTLLGMEDVVVDPLLAQATALFGEAPFVQLYWDRFLPPDLADLHKTTTQEIFALIMSPEEAAIEMEEAAAAAESE